MILVNGAALAAEPEQCRTVRLGTANQTDVIVSSTVVKALLSGLGYRVRQTSTPQQIVPTGLAGKQLDLLLGYWQPAIQPVVRPYLDKGRTEMIEPPTLANAQSTYAILSYVAEGGPKIFTDITRFESKLGDRIYAIEPGSGSNRIARKMIDDNRFSLKGFQLVESGEAGTPTMAKRATKRKQWVVFFGWKPHLMNLQIDMTYLTGSEDVFGSDGGAAIVSTITAAGYQAQRGNVARLLHNLRFSSAQASQAMAPILDHTQLLNATHQWLKASSEPLKAWLDGVSALDGKDGLAALQAPLK